MKFSALIGVLILAGAAYYIRGAFEKAISEATASPSPGCLQLTGSTTREVDGVTRIFGTIRNDCKRKYSHVQVVFQLDRQPIDTSLTLNSGLYGHQNENRTSVRPIDQTPFENMAAAPIVASGSDLKPGDEIEVSTLPVSRGVSYRVGEVTGY